MGLKSSLSFSDIDANINALDARVGRIQSALAEYANMTDVPYEVARPIGAATPYITTPDTGIEPPTGEEPPAQSKPAEPRVPPETLAQLTDAFDALALAHNNLVRLYKKDKQRLRRASQQIQ